MARRSAKRRLQVRLSGELYEVAEHVAGRSGVSLGSFVRLLVEDALATRPQTVPEALVGRGDVEARVSVLAGLVASENALLALEKFLPKERWESDVLRTEAIRRAEQRLAEVRAHVDKEQL
jgi:hypothetical protein